MYICTMRVLIWPASRLGVVEIQNTGQEERFCWALCSLRQIYYWSKRKRRNYSRYNRYHKCCVRKL